MCVRWKMCYNCHNLVSTAFNKDLNFVAVLLLKQPRNIQFPPRGKHNDFPLQRPPVNAAYGNKSCLFLEPNEAGQRVLGLPPGL
jgi:hypothetical protein